MLQEAFCSPISDGSIGKGEPVPKCTQRVSQETSPKGKRGEGALYQVSNTELKMRGGAQAMHKISVRA